MPNIIRCLQCGHVVPHFFHHIAIDCEHGMTEEEIAALLREAGDDELTDTVIRDITRDPDFA